MNFTYGMLLPSIFGLKIFKEINKENNIKNNNKDKNKDNNTENNKAKSLTKIDYAYYYCMLVLFSNTISVFISRFLFDLTTAVEESLNISPMFSFKYICLNLFVNFILVIFITIFKKNVSYSLQIRIKHEKKAN